ncbi:hypothetical protein APSETT444_001620 [Aspergillus pseudonomiae]
MADHSAHLMIAKVLEAQKAKAHEMKHASAFYQNLEKVLDKRRIDHILGLASIVGVVVTLIVFSPVWHNAYVGEVCVAVSVKEENINGSIIVTLEALPPEMKTAVLYAIPDLASPNALVHASPCFHALYLSQRKQLLSTVLARCLQLPVMVDAVAALIALRGRQDRCKAPKPALEAAEEFLRKYVPLRSILNPPYPYSADEYLDQELDVYQAFASLTEDDLLEMARLHTIVEFILKDMVHSFFGLRPDTQKPKGKDTALSPPETFRMQRAIYRLEIHRLLFSSNELPWFEGQDRLSDIYVDSDAQWDLFLSLFAPWEMEEIRCVLMYIFRVYRELPGATNFDDWCELFPDENEDPLSHLYDHEIDDDHRDHYVSLGLEFLYHWMHVSSIACREECLLKQKAVLCGTLNGAVDFIANALDANRTTRKEEYDIDFGDEGTCGRVFLSDTDWNSPNLAWTWCLSTIQEDASKYLWRYGHSALRNWGFLFWDEHRLKEWCLGLEMIREIYNSGFDEPRDMDADLVEADGDE